MASELAPTEIKALARILDEIDYYQLIHVERNASAREIKSAYYATCRAFHPDANRHLSDDLRGAVGRIAKRVTEAYSVLRDPRRRAAYDRNLAAGGPGRMQLSEAAAAAGRRAQEEQGRTPQGRQYFNRATVDLRRNDFAAAARNLQMALTFEPDNAFFKAKLEEARAKQR